MKTRKEKIDAIIEILNEAKNEQSECESSLVRIYQHMFKCYYQPNKHSQSWDDTIIERHKALRKYINPDIGNFLKKKKEHIFIKAFNAAIKDMKITNKSEKRKCEYSCKVVMSEWTIDDISKKDFLNKFFRMSPESTNTYYDTDHLREYLK